MSRIVLFLLLTCLSATALTVESEQAQIKTIGGMDKESWSLWSNGEWGDFIQIEKPGTYQLEIQARGTPMAGIWPRAVITVDGERAIDFKVETLALKRFTFPLSLPEGIHRLTIKFTNDERNADEDRNLYLKQMTLTTTDGLNAPTLARAADWQSPLAKQEIQVLAQADLSIEKFRKEDAMILVKDVSGKVVPGASVKIALVRHEFLFGCNLLAFDRFPNSSDNETYKRRFADLFNFATTGFYWRDYEKTPGQPNYAYTDKVLTWCEEHHIQVKGHPLLWGNPAGIPPWIQGLPSPEAQYQRITDILNRYRNRIEYWEIVNEPAHFTNLKIDDPYRWAQETDPQAHLIVNDCYVLADGCPAFYALLQHAIAQQIPFDGIGIQAHEPRNRRFDLVSIKKILDRYGQLGKDLYITEFTPESSGQPIIQPLNSDAVWDEQAQADYAVRFYTACFANPFVKGITWWDLCDRMSWRKNGGLLRDDLTPKPAYLALTQLIHEKWTTRAQGQTDTDGVYSFRGFRGTYSVTVEFNGKSSQSEFDLHGTGPQNVNVILP